jgi:hypothetical protein
MLCLIGEKRIKTYLKGSIENKFIIAKASYYDFYCKVQVYIYIYSLHLALIAKHLYSDICVIQKRVVSLNS